MRISIISVLLIAATTWASDHLIDIDDAILDINMLEGKNICVKGNFVYDSGIVHMSKTFGSGESLLVSTDTLSRDIRKTLMKSNCTFMNGGCNNVTICGKVDFMGMIEATNISY